MPYARALTGIPIYGDAWTWWNQAAGRYRRGSEPESGAMMVLDGYAGPHRAHLAVVRTVISAAKSASITPIGSIAAIFISTIQ